MQLNVFKLVMEMVFHLLRVLMAGIELFNIIKQSSTLTDSPAVVLLQSGVLMYLLASTGGTIQLISKSGGQHPL